MSCKLPSVSKQRQKAITLQEVRELLSAISEENLASKTKDQQTELLDAVLSTLRDLARESFYVFVLLMGPLIVPEGFKDGRHIEIICDALQSLYESIVNPKRSTERLQIFLPPRAMKSRMGSILFPSWVLGKKPDWNIICVGNSVKFAEDEFGRNVRDLIRSRAYSYIFPDTELRTDAKAVGLFTTTAGGKYMATGAGAQLAGRGAHLTICLKAGTKVLEKTKGWLPIEDVKPLDLIHSKQGFQIVTEAVANHHKLFYTINNDLETSPEHPLFSKDRNEWVNVKDLKVGERIETATLWKKLRGAVSRIRLGKQCGADVASLEKHTGILNTWTKALQSAQSGQALSLHSKETWENDPLLSSLWTESTTLSDTFRETVDGPQRKHRLIIGPTT